MRPDRIYTNAGVVTFDERSDDAEVLDAVGHAILRHHRCTIVRVPDKGSVDDRAGCDVVVRSPGGAEWGVDFKHRGQGGRPDYARERDYAIELVSGPGTPGWAIDQTKRTHIVMWIWHQSKHYALVEYPVLRAALGDEDAAAAWAKQYGRRDRRGRVFRSQESGGGWWSSVVMAPYREMVRLVTSRGVVDTREPNWPLREPPYRW